MREEKGDPTAPFVSGTFALLELKTMKDFGKQSILSRDRVRIGTEPVGGERFTTKDTKSAKRELDGLSKRVITGLNGNPDVTFCPPSCSS
jgi:hypothetical protein